jgi:hypothetical protein
VRSADVKKLQHECSCSQKVTWKQCASRIPESAAGLDCTPTAALQKQMGRLETALRLVPERPCCNLASHTPKASSEPQSASSSFVEQLEGAFNCDTILNLVFAWSYTLTRHFRIHASKPQSSSPTRPLTAPSSLLAGPDLCHIDAFETKFPSGARGCRDWNAYRCRISKFLFRMTQPQVGCVHVRLYLRTSGPSVSTSCHSSCGSDMTPPVSCPAACHSANLEAQQTCQTHSVGHRS